MVNWLLRLGLSSQGTWSKIQCSNVILPKGIKYINALIRILSAYNYIGNAHISVYLCQTIKNLSSKNRDSVGIVCDVDDWSYNRSFHTRKTLSCPFCTTDYIYSLHPIGPRDFSKDLARDSRSERSHDTDHPQCDFLFLDWYDLIRRQCGRRVVFWISGGFMLVYADFTDYG